MWHPCSDLALGLNIYIQMTAHLSTEMWTVYFLYVFFRTLNVLANIFSLHKHSFHFFILLNWLKRNTKDISCANLHKSFKILPFFYKH
jgi:hypothetical protein